MHEQNENGAHGPGQVAGLKEELVTLRGADEEPPLTSEQVTNLKQRVEEYNNASLLLMGPHIISIVFRWASAKNDLKARCVVRSCSAVVRAV